MDDLISDEGETFKIFSLCAIHAPKYTEVYSTVNRSAKTTKPIERVFNRPANDARYLILPDIGFIYV
jgi:hypothetical protein